MKIIAILMALAVSLSACGISSTDQATLIAGGQTLVAVAAAQNTSVASVVSKGALFCRKVDPLAPLVVALANAAGAPMSVTNQTAQAVAEACASVQAIPVAPPADAASTPVVAAPVAVLPPVS